MGGIDITEGKGGIELTQTRMHEGVNLKGRRRKGAGKLKERMEKGKGREEVRGAL